MHRVEDVARESEVESESSTEMNFALPSKEQGNRLDANLL